MNTNELVNEYLKKNKLGWVWTKPLELQRQNALTCYKTTKYLYRETPTAEHWKDFCICKSWCMQLGVRI